MFDESSLIDDSDDFDFYDDHGSDEF